MKTVGTVGMILALAACVLGIANAVRRRPSDRVGQIAAAMYVVGAIALVASVIAWAVRP